MSQENDDYVGEVVTLYFLCQSGIQQTGMQDWQGLDLTMAQLKVMVTLGFEGSLTISKLAEALAISHPTVSHLVEKLVQARLVERGEDVTDRRYTLAHLTAEGETVFQRLRQGRLDRLRNCLAQLDERDIDALHQGLEALVRVLQATPSRETGRHQFRDGNGNSLLHRKNEDASS
jgi:DNA-binding MarR family transcriptional regulator